MAQEIVALGYFVSPVRPLAMDNRTIGRGLAIMLTVTGLAHFIFPAPIDGIVPAFLPGEPRFWTYISGVAELVVAAMLFVPMDKSFAGKPIRLWGVYSAAALFLAVYPANINMAIEWSSRPMPEPLFAIARLPLQFGLFYWCWALAKAMKQPRA